MGTIKLFCIPYAGGSSAIYARWSKYLKPSIELCPIELSGRGKRYEETLYKSVDNIVEDVYKSIKDIGETEFALFGHSLGSIIAYELAFKIFEGLGKWPAHIFFSGNKAPQFRCHEDPIHTLSDERFKEKLLEKGGTPKEVLDNKELLEIFLPVLRADFCANDTYNYIERELKLECDITIFNGKKDNMTINEIVGWRKHTNGECKIYMIEGGHFFINDRYQDVINIINNTI